MTQDQLTALSIQPAARFRALRWSYHIKTTPAHQRAALAMAPRILQIRPGIYANQTFTWTIDLWSMSCTCATMRNRKRAGKTARSKPCIHFTALYLAGIWTPCDENPTFYLTQAGVNRPQILAFYCRANLPPCYPPAPLGFRVIDMAKNAITLLNLATGTYATTTPATIKRVKVFYE